MLQNPFWQEYGMTLVKMAFEAFLPRPHGMFQVKIVNINHLEKCYHGENARDKWPESRDFSLKISLKLSPKLLQQSGHDQDCCLTGG